MGANLINDKLRNQQHISESENLNKSTNKNPLYIVFSITDYYEKYNLKFYYRNFKSRTERPVANI